MRLPESVMTTASWGGVVLVQVTLVALLGLLAWLLARKGGPALRGAVLLATLVGLLFLPGLAGLAPTWLPLPECMCPAGIVPPSAAPAVAGRPSPFLPGSDERTLTFQVKLPLATDMLESAGPGKKTIEAVGPLATSEGDFDLTVPPEVAVLPTSAGERPASSRPVATLLSVVWLLGVLFCLGRSSLRLMALCRCSWQAREVLDQEWIDELASLARRDDLPGVSLKESPAIASPLTLGLFRPVILLPPGWKTWSAGERILILEHELAHIRRRDFLVGLVVELVVCLCWFHPLVLWLASRLRLEQEYSADAWVASVVNDSHEYICCLARLALEHSQGRGPLAPALWRRRPEILRRIDMLQNTPKGLPTRLSKPTAALVAVVAAAACLVVASVGPLGSSAVAKPTENDSDAKSREDSLGDPLPAGVLARLGTLRLRHQGEVTFVSFVAGGKLLTASKDNTIRLWDLEARTEIRRFTRPTPVAVKNPNKGAKGKAMTAENFSMYVGQGNRGGSFQVALTADGKTLAAAGGNVIQLWELSTGKELRKIIVPDSGLSGMIFSPDGRTLAARTAVGAIHLWSAGTGNEIHHIKPAPRPAQRGLVFAIGGGGGLTPAPGMAFTSDSKTLAFSAKEFQKNEPIRSLKFIDVASGKEIRKIDAPKGVGVSSVAITQDGKLLAYGAGNVVHVRAADTGKELHKITAADGIHMLVFSPDGKTLAVRGLNERVRLWEAKTGKELHQLNDAELSRRSGGWFIFANDDLSGPEIRAVAFSPDSKQIASAAGTTIRVWNTATGKEVPLIDSHWRAPSIIVLSADGKIVISWAADRVVRRWEQGTGKPLGAFPAPARTTMAAFSPDGRSVALANKDNSIRLHDTFTGKELSRLKGPANGTLALAFAPGGKELAVRGSGDNTIHLYDLSRKEEVRQLVIKPKNPQPQNGFVVFLNGQGGGPGTGPGLAFSPDGKLVATPFGGNGDRSNSIVFFDAATSKELRKIESPQPIASFAFSTDSRTLATEYANGTITLWEVASGKQRAQLGKAPVQKPAGNGNALFIDVTIDAGLGALSSTGGPVGISFSPDGRALAVTAPDRSVHIWDVLAGKEIGQLRGHQGGLQTVTFAANGKMLASGSNDTTALLWDTAGALKELARLQSIELTAEEVSSLWNDLAGTDATKAVQSVHKLTAGAKQAVPYLGKHLKPAARVELQKINGWMADLESEKFSVRQEAATQLLKVGQQAVPPLKKLLAAGPPLETRRRAEELVDRLTSGTLTSEQLRVVRAVEALEQIGTPEARRLLKTLADGGPGELPTREAQSALNRLATSKP